MPGQAAVLEAGPAPLIAVRAVARSFAHARTTVQALADCTLQVRRGEFVSLIGPSGCGKSTLLRIVGGLLAPDAGDVVVDGRSPRANRADKRFGFVPQTPALLPWRSVVDNVRLLKQVNSRAGSASTAEETDPRALLRSVGLGQFVNSLPRELSGGMQQRVALVRAFALGAPILLMDEPFAALDEITRASMRYGLLEMWERTGNTVLFVTHSIAEAVMLSDRVLVFGGRPGRIVEEVHITLPRPRVEAMEDSAQFVEHVRSVRLALRGGWTQ
jgi:NitT/TauT family transport system ATP-binding protein